MPAPRPVRCPLSCDPRHVKLLLLHLYTPCHTQLQPSILVDRDLRQTDLDTPSVAEATHLQVGSETILVGEGSFIMCAGFRPSDHENCVVLNGPVWGYGSAVDTDWHTGCREEHQLRNNQKARSQLLVQQVDQTTIWRQKQTEGDTTMRTIGNLRVLRWVAGTVCFALEHLTPAASTMPKHEETSSSVVNARKFFRADCCASVQVHFIPRPTRDKSMWHHCCGLLHETGVVAKMIGCCFVSFYYCLHRTLNEH